jgi:hypothetical protein
VLKHIPGRTKNKKKINLPVNPTSFQQREFAENPLKSMHHYSNKKNEKDFEKRRTKF